MNLITLEENNFPDIESTKAKMSNDEFKLLSEFIYNGYGIKLSPIKKIMLQGRLQKRLRENNFRSFKEYIDYVFSTDGLEKEVVHMIDAVSTNKTDFFREAPHFDFMKEKLLPEFLESDKSHLKIWSAASSSGEELYTIAIVISEFLEGKNSFDYSILGTDISLQILQKAALAVYSKDRVERIPTGLRNKYFLKSKNTTHPTVRVTGELRNKTSYQRLNLMDESYAVPGDYDIIFCRNVLIYFDRPTQEKVINKLCSKLKKDGYLFLGHSESLTGLNLPLKQIRPTIFKKMN
jgi:chemotaxis protein methyltransferase CheR